MRFRFALALIRCVTIIYFNVISTHIVNKSYYGLHGYNVSRRRTLSHNTFRIRVHSSIYRNGWTVTRLRVVYARVADRIMPLFAVLCTANNKNCSRQHIILSYTYQILFIDWIECGHSTVIVNDQYNSNIAERDCGIGTRNLIVGILYYILLYTYAYRYHKYFMKTSLSMHVLPALLFDWTLTTKSCNKHGQPSSILI